VAKSEPYDKNNSYGFKNPKVELFVRKKDPKSEVTVCYMVIYSVNHIQSPQQSTLVKDAISY
jgi:hypothetical protein